MRSSRFRSIVSALFGLSFYVCVYLLCPSRAYALWQEVITNNSSYNLAYMVNSSTSPTSFSPISSPATSAGAYSYSKAIHGYNYYPNSTTGQVWNGYPSTSNAVLVMYANMGSTVLSSGNRVMVKVPGNMSVYVGVTSGSTVSYTSKNINCTNFKYFVVSGGLSRTQQVAPNEFGVITLPFDCQYVVATCNVTNLSTALSGMTYWYVYTGLSISVELPEDQNEVAAINEQTDTLMDTTGGDTIAGNTIIQYQQMYENLGPVAMLEDIGSELSAAVFSQDESGTVSFPGMSWSGFVIPAATVDVWDYLPSIQPTVRTITTFLFVSAFVRYLYNLVDSIFGSDVHTGGDED